MEGHKKFTPSGDWEKDIKQYRHTCEGHVQRYTMRIAEKEKATPSAPRDDQARRSGQIDAIHASSSPRSGTITGSGLASSRQQPTT